jgi:lysophospholipase L1-like esterase
MVGIRTNLAINGLNSLLQVMAEKEDVHFIDITEELIDKDGQLHLDYTFDGLHPNAVGYEIITRSIVPLLR